jgi:hypothetical protein
MLHNLFIAPILTPYILLQLVDCFGKYKSIIVIMYLDTIIYVDA